MVSFAAPISGTAKARTRDGQKAEVERVATRSHWLDHADPFCLRGWVQEGTKKLPCMWTVTGNWWHLGPHQKDLVQ